MPTYTDPEAQKGENVVTPWEESPLKTIWREVEEGRYPSVERVKEIMRGSSEQSIGELLVQRGMRR